MQLFKFQLLHGSVHRLNGTFTVAITVPMQFGFGQHLLKSALKQTSGKNPMLGSISTGLCSPEQMHAMHLRVKHSVHSR
jgi:hypothetical protein